MTEIDFSDCVAVFKSIDTVKESLDKHVRLLPQGSDKFAEKRKLEFIAGRLCAEKAMKDLTGKSLAAPEIGPSREPLWPEGIVGSISHSKNLAVAVVSQKKTNIGIDIEPIIVIERFDKIGSQFVTKLEEPQVNSDPTLGTIIFSAKEALYKALYPSVGEFFGFNDAQVLEITEDRFKIQVLIKDPPFESYKSPIIGQYQLLNNEIITFISLP